MSIYFISDERVDLWNPANVTGRRFLDQAESVGREVGMPTGLGSIRSDEVVVQRDAFLSFAKALVDRWHQTTSGSGFRVRAAGCLGIVGALALKLDPTPLTDDGTVAELIASARV